MIHLINYKMTFNRTRHVVLAFLQNYHFFRVTSRTKNNDKAKRYKKWMVKNPAKLRVQENPWLKNDRMHLTVHKNGLKMLENEESREKTLR